MIQWAQQYSDMRRKQCRIPIQYPFGSIHTNWEQLTSLERLLSRQVECRNELPSIQSLLSTCHSLLTIVDALRLDHTRCLEMAANANSLQLQLKHHDQIVASLETKFRDRTSQLLDQNKIIRETNQKLKKTIAENEDRFLHDTAVIRAENKKNVKRIAEMEVEKCKFMQDMNDMQTKIDKQEDIISKLLMAYNEEKQQKQHQSQRRGQSMQDILLDGKLCSKIISYLDITSASALLQLNRITHLMQCKSKKCNNARLLSLSRSKERKLRYYYNHLEYFQRRYNKIPEEVIQQAYFQCYVLKQPLSPWILPVLNQAACILDGKVSESELPILVLNDYYKSPEHQYINVDQLIISECMSERRSAHTKLQREYQSMEERIAHTRQLYRADERSTALFIDNVIKHFTKLFVSCKHLYAEARAVHQLNVFLIKELVARDGVEINHCNVVEDLKAQMEAEEKLKIFFTEKCRQSEQKALKEENIRLNVEMKMQKLQEISNKTCNQLKETVKKYEELLGQYDQISIKNSQLKRMYEHHKDKHFKVIEELSIVKETILRMNLI